MPNYRFTTAVDGDVEHSDEPMAYPSDKAATDAAQVCMAEMARDTMPLGSAPSSRHPSGTIAAKRSTARE